MTDGEATDSGRKDEARRYEIRVGAELDDRWSSWFDGLELTHDADGGTTMTGPVTDDAALHGLLARVRDLGLPLLSVRRLDPPDR